MKPPSCLAPTGPALSWGCWSCSGPGSATLRTQRMGSDDLEILNEPVIPSMDGVLYSKMAARIPETLQTLVGTIPQRKLLLAKLHLTKIV